MKCLVCHEPCRSEGQLCPACVERGHRVENDTLLLNIDISLPKSLQK